jgi:WD40 repeat protein
LFCPSLYGHWFCLEQVLQTLDKHKGYVVKVKWSLENYHHDIASPYTLRLASADYNGKIIVWDVGQASIRAEFSDGSKPVAGR